MKIALLSDSKTGINIFPELKKRLSKKIADVEIQESFVNAPEDLPLKAKELAESNSLVFVFSLYDEKDKKVEMILEKLVGIELETGTKIVKAVEESELDVSTEEQFEEERERLAEKWSETILKTLFKPEEFSPKEDIPKGTIF